ncbi:carboxypeptidase-like regulatory domain-containing protein [Dyadobacter subterraneus]|uniref:Carboxypeptidase-like regulatory domain-containing protein n=1 Tax=Dyadobacter subterraneus TaxID=2773304 RepID=A0ABR9WHZ1_9BACT|nr:carboxypeptidase-like regulatory domain-containing protein [Dyadobacter subterraneus]MBE9463971.1 carboxypeptidase-like regulatory domain-containing protein [Dyadobacter subterraneus]
MTRKYLIVSLFIILSFQVSAQKKEVGGIVTSAENRDLLSGIVVWVKGSNQGLVTGKDGYFDLTVSEGDTIEASSRYFQSKEIVVGSGWKYEIRLDGNKNEERTGFLRSKTPDTEEKLPDSETGSIYLSERKLKISGH